MAATRVEARFHERKRIEFTARERAMINVRVESADGGPLGFTSYELLLIALANCSMGVVMNHESLKEANVRSFTATLEAEPTTAPARLEKITIRLDLDVAGGDERLQQTLQRVAEACPIGNTLRSAPEIAVQLSVRDSGAVRASAAG